MRNWNNKNKDQDLVVIQETKQILMERPLNLNPLIKMQMEGRDWKKKNNIYLVLWCQKKIGPPNWILRKKDTWLERKKSKKRLRKRMGKILNFPDNNCVKLILRFELNQHF